MGTHDKNLMPVIAGTTSDLTGDLSNEIVEFVEAVVRSLGAYHFINVDRSESAPTTPSEYDLWLKPSYKMGDLLFSSELKVWKDGRWESMTPRFFSEIIFNNRGLSGCVLEVPKFNVANYPYNEKDVVCDSAGNFYQSNESNNRTAPPSAKWDTVTINDAFGGGAAAAIVIKPTLFVNASTLVDEVGTEDIFKLSTTGFMMNPVDESTHASTDWQISKVSDFSDIIWEELNSPAKLAIATNNLGYDGSVYIRSRHISASGIKSMWAVSQAVRSNPKGEVSTPVTLNVSSGTQGNALGAEDFYRLNISGFNIKPSYATHASTDWEMSTTSDFSNVIWSSLNNSAYKTSITTGHTQIDGSVYIRARIKSSKGAVSNWKVSAEIPSKATVDDVVKVPTLTISPSTVSEGDTFNITSSDFALDDGDGTHKATHWVMSDSNVSNPIGEEPNDTANPLSHTFTAPTGKSRVYIFARHLSSNDVYSEWTPPYPVVINPIYDSVNKPSITSPSNGAAKTVGDYLQVTASAFGLSVGSGTHVSTDWQLASNSSFTSIVLQSMNNASNKTLWPTTLSRSGAMYFRVRYKTSNGFYSSWSSTVNITVSDKTDIVRAPNWNSSTINTMVNSSFTLSASAMSLSQGTGSHASTDWHISKTTSFATIIWQTNQNSSNKTSINTSRGASGTVYARVRYRTTNNVVSPWSSPLTINVAALPDIVNTPSVTSPSGSLNLPTNNKFQINASSFSKAQGTGTLAAGQFQVAKDSGFSNIVYNETRTSGSLMSTVATVDDAIHYGTMYIRVRYKTSNNVYSSWSTPKQITIQQEVQNDIVNKPSIIWPLAFKNVSRGSMITIMSSSFSLSQGNGTHSTTDWEICGDGSTCSKSHPAYRSAYNSTAMTAKNMTLSYNSGAHFIRCRYKSSNGVYSPWSDVLPISAS